MGPRTGCVTGTGAGRTPARGAPGRAAADPRSSSGRCSPPARPRAGPFVVICARTGMHRRQHGSSCPPGCPPEGCLPQGGLSSRKKALRHVGRSPSRNKEARCWRRGDAHELRRYGAPVTTPDVSPGHSQSRVRRISTKRGLLRRPLCESCRRRRWALRLGERRHHCAIGAFDNATFCQSRRLRVRTSRPPRSSLRVAVRSSSSGRRAGSAWLFRSSATHMWNPAVLRPKCRSARPPQRSGLTSTHT